MSGAPGDPPRRGTPDPLLRSLGVRKSKCLIVRCLRAKPILKPVLSWATWATAEAIACIGQNLHKDHEGCATQKFKFTTKGAPPASPPFQLESCLLLCGFGRSGAPRLVKDLSRP